MDVVVLPSLFGEGLPLSLLEAMARGRAVVATRTEGNDEAAADGETGLLVAAGDDGALADAIGELLADAGKRAGMGEAGRRRAVALFGVEAMVRGYERVYGFVAYR